MLATIRVDDEQAMAVLSYASPAFERSRARAESAGDRGRAFRAVFAPFPEDKENVDPNSGAAYRRKMDPRTPRDRCEPSRPPLADITPKFLMPVRVRTDRAARRAQFEIARQENIEENRRDRTLGSTDD